MDNHERRVRYLLQSGRCKTLDAAEDRLAAAYEAGDADSLLTPAQRRRAAHKRGGTGAHRARQRAARKSRLAALAARFGGPAAGS